MKKTTYILTALSVLIMSVGTTSCIATKSYKAPQVDPENLYRSDESSDTNTIANIPWKG